MRHTRQTTSAVYPLIFALAAVITLGLSAAAQVGQKTVATVSRNSEKGAMSAAYSSGKLPSPLTIQASGDALASALAKKVVARNEESTPALITAILTSGFGIRDAKGNVLQSVKPGQGLAFDDWEIAAIAKMYGETRGVPLSHLAGGLGSIPEMKGLQLDTILLQGIRKHAESDEPSMRFWARFIVELGKNRKAPEDLLAAGSRNIELDAIQVSFILRRLIGDYYALSRGGQRTSARAEVSPSYLYASWASPSYLNSGRRSAARNCGSALGEGDAATILDVGAAIITSGWGELLDKAGLGKGAEAYSRFLTVANIILAYAKFIATYAALETEIKVDNEPLVRTKNSRPGERRQLTATVTMDTGGWENINCFRTALNVATGLDFSLIKDGPLDGVEVNWHLDQGQDYYSNSTGVTGNKPIVGFAGENTARIQDAGTYAGVPGRGGRAVGNLTRTKTDKNGNATIFLEGAPKVPYVADPVRTVMKDVGVRTTIKLKGGDIKGDAADVFGQALGVILSGASALVTMPLDLLYRTDWASSGYLTVAVKDHERCDGEWAGTITYTETYKNVRSYQDKNQTTSSSESDTYEASIDVGGERENSSQRVLVYGGKVRASASRNQSRHGRGTSTALCNLENTSTTNGSGRFEGIEQVGISLMPDDTYRLSYQLPTVEFTAETSRSRKILECKNPFIKPSSSTGSIDVRINPSMIDIEGSLDPKNPHVIKGSKTVDIPESSGTRTATVKWDLVRCGR